jgi:hypothetical protein
MVMDISQTIVLGIKFTMILFKNNMMDDKQFANEYYRKYKEDEFSECSASYAYITYDILNKRGMIHLSKAQKADYMVQATKDYESRQWEPEKEGVPISALLKADAVLNHTHATAINNIAKELALMDLFSTWKQEGRIRIIN